VFTLTALAVFGFVKGKFTGVSRIQSALQTVLVGGLAAGVAYALARLIS
jgi:VIT1/CCC1 family predicted Fe2+/Mn2+ transporter